MVLQDESEEELIQDGALLAFLQFNGISNERWISSWIWLSWHFQLNQILMHRILDIHIGEKLVLLEHLPVLTKNKNITEDILYRKWINLGPYKLLILLRFMRSNDKFLSSMAGKGKAQHRKILEAIFESALYVMINVPDNQKGLASLHTSV